MSGKPQSIKLQSMSSPMTLITSNQKEVPVQSASTLRRKRSAVAVSEHEDACLTGMTKSLDRRLLALNLQPVPAASEFGFMKVA
jgi:hypothetical protein